MKEIKEFIQELCDCAKPSANGSVVALEDATRIVRRVQRMQVKQIASLNDILEYEISQPNELINDWDVCDWKFDYRNPRWRDNHTPEELKRFCCK